MCQRVREVDGSIKPGVERGPRAGNPRGVLERAQRAPGTGTTKSKKEPAARAIEIEGTRKVSAREKLIEFLCANEIGYDEQ